MFAVFKKDAQNPTSAVYGNFSTARQYKEMLPPDAQCDFIIKQLRGEEGWSECEQQCLTCGQTTNATFCSAECVKD